MPVRVTGMISGLDTEALVSAMVSAYGVKKKKTEKNVQTLKWKQDAWSGINTKIKSLYSSVSNLRFTSAYTLKKATISDPTKATVTAGSKAVTGSQKLKVKQLATAGYLTGGKLAKRDNKAVTSSTKLSELKNGLSSGSGSITVTVGGKTTDIAIDQDTTVGSLVNSLKDAGLSANFDEKNGRIFVAAQKSGQANDFSLVANNAGGSAALSAFGLNVQSDANEAMYKAYKDYATAGNDFLGGGPISSADDVKTILANINANKTSITTEKGIIADLTDEKKYAENLKAVNEAYAKLDNASASDLKNILDHGDFNGYAVYNSTTGEYDFYSGKETVNGETTYFNVDENGERTQYQTFTEDTPGQPKHGAITELAGDIVKNSIQSAIDALDENDPDDKKKVQALNEEFKSEVQRLDSDGNPVVDGEGKPVMDLQFDNGKISNFLSGIASRQSSMDTYRTEHAAEASAIDGNTDLGEFIRGKQEAIDLHNAEIGRLQDQIDANGLAAVGGVPDPSDEDYDTKLTQAANDIWNKIQYYSGKYDEVTATTTIDGEEVRTYAGYSEGAVRVNAVDAEIELNGAQYISDSNSFVINDLTINVTGVTDDEGVTITTDTDSQAIYDKIKDFFKEYNAMMTLMAKSYNADSSKGYEPLSEEEKDAMSDKEVERWETKIKDSILRKDNSLSSIMNAMSSAMSQRYEINGKYYSLSSFGIKTKNYFETSENDNYEYHIDGDKDDSYSSGNADKLLAAINADPDGVVEFFRNITSGLYDAMDKKMKGTTMSSAYSIYNDKQMKSQLASYEKEVSSWEKKITDYEDYWYRKYASMESTLAKLQSQTSSLGNMMG